MKLLVLTVLILLSNTALASTNAGFVNGLWFSKEKPFVGEPIRIYVAIRNHTGSDLVGKVEFLVDDNKIGSKEVSALDNRLVESWIDWIPTYGQHQISANLTKVELSKPGTQEQNIKLPGSQTDIEIFVDYDTDKDGVGNEEDPDDDGDGLEDTDDDEPLIPKKDPPPLEKSDDQNDPKDKTKTDKIATSVSPTGLEKYLSENRADSALTSITEVINNTKDRLDDYRQSRNLLTETSRSSSEINIDNGVTNTNNLNEQSDTSSTTAKETSSFGAVTRTKEDGSWLASLWSLIKNGGDKIYTLVLFLLSTYLGHPALVQVTLLILVLFIIFKVARRLSARPF